jgi:S-adenosylmethionine decarboxylase proenzyme
METKSTHMLIELWNCKHLALLDSCELMEQALREIAEVVGVNILHTYFHKFMPQGVSGVLVISESHFSVHTWAEEDIAYAALDFFTCGDKMPILGIPKLLELFEPEKYELMEVDRGRTDFNFSSLRLNHIP